MTIPSSTNRRPVGPLVVVPQRMQGTSPCSCAPQDPNATGGQIPQDTNYTLHTVRASVHKHSHLKSYTVAPLTCKWDVPILFYMYI